MGGQCGGGGGGDRSMARSGKWGGEVIEAWLEVVSGGGGGDDRSMAKSGKWGGG